MKVYIQKTQRCGKGLFAVNKIKKGKVIGLLHGKVCFWNNDDRKLNDDYFMQVDWDKWLYVLPPERYLNHSCEPNAGIKGRRVIALRNIQKDEEITVDYDLFEYWNQMSCSCGSKKCRKVIKGYEYLPYAVQRKYWGYVANYLLERIQSLS